MVLVEFVALWRADARLRRLFWLPTLLGFLGYAAIGTAGWFAIAPFLEAWFGEWEIVGRFLALGLWLSAFQFVFVLLASVFAEAVHEPLAARIEALRGVETSADRNGLGVWLSDSLVRIGVTFAATTLSVVAGAWVPWLAPLAVVFCSGWSAVAAGAGVCANRHGVRFGSVVRTVLWPLDRRCGQAILVCGLIGVFPLATAFVLPLATALGTLLFLERRASLEAADSAPDKG